MLTDFYNNNKTEKTTKMKTVLKQKQNPCKVQQNMFEKDQLGMRFERKSVKTRRKLENLRIVFMQCKRLSIRQALNMLTCST